MEQPEQYQPDQPQSRREEYSLGISQSQSPDLQKWMMDLSPEIREVVNDLLGLKLDMSSRPPRLIQFTEPLMNIKGVMRLVTLSKLDLSKNKILSDFDEDMINRMVKQYMNQICVLLYEKADEYEMEDVYIPNVIGMFGRSVLATYRRAYLGGEKKLLRETTQRSEVHTQGQGNKGIAAKFAGFFK